MRHKSTNKEPAIRTSQLQHRVTIPYTRMTDRHLARHITTRLHCKVRVCGFESHKCFLVGFAGVDNQIVAFFVCFITSSCLHFLRI